MRTPTRDDVVDQTRNDKKIAKAKESEWPVLLDESEGQARGSSGQNCDRCEEHQPLVHIHSTAKIERCANQNREYQHVAERNSQKYQRRRKTRRRLKTLRSDDC